MRTEAEIRNHLENLKAVQESACDHTGDPFGEIYCQAAKQQTALQIDTLEWVLGKIHEAYEARVKGIAERAVVARQRPKTPAGHRR